MFSGGDSSDGMNSMNQLGAYGLVNQVAVTNAMAAGQNIDWAQLAQQWIQMRDNSELQSKTQSNLNVDKIVDSSCNNFKFEEKGEADMDMDDEEQTEDKTQRINNDFAPSSVIQNLNDPPWFYGDGSSQIAAHRTTGNNQWIPWPNRELLTQPLPNHNVINNRPTNSTAHIPSLLKITVPHPSEIRIMPDNTNQPENTTMMDAAKRKGLPAWIREGLEKMEREKQKQLEKQQQKDFNSSDEDNTSNKNILAKSLSLNGEAISVLEESSDNEDSSIINANREIDVNLKKNDDEENDVRGSQGHESYEQKLADLMTVVRRTLTELLLEATNEEIFMVADETVKTFKSKASSAQVIRKSALSTLTGKLGLAAYGDSSSENDSSDDDDDCSSSKKATGQSDSDNNSDEEIRNVIRSKRRAFIKISEEIEERVASAAVREEEKLKFFLRKEEEEEREHIRKKQERPLLREPSTSGHCGHNNKGYEKDFGEITETKIQHLNGKRQKDRSSRRERITRFSDNKDKYVALSTPATFFTSINSSASNSGSVNPTALPANSQRQNIPDINGLLPNYSNIGMTNVLNAADAALEKVLKGKASASPEKSSRRRHDRDRKYTQSRKRQRLSNSKNSRSRSKSSSSSTSSSSSSTTSDSDSSSTSQSSHHSKSKHRSATKHKSHTSTDKQHEKSHKDHRNDRKYSSYSYRKSNRESTSRHNRRNASSDSDDEYHRRRRHDSHYTRNSSQARSYTSSRHDREHSRSHSRSSYSSSSNRRK